MLTIRRPQMEVISLPAYNAYVRRMVEYIASDFPRQFNEMGPAGASEFVTRAIEKGRSNHIETEGGVAVLIQLMIEFGENFENSPDKEWADEMLAHPTLPAQLKVRLLRERMTALSKGRVIVRFTG